MLKHQHWVSSETTLKEDYHLFVMCMFLLRSLSSPLIGFPDSSPWQMWRVYASWADLWPHHSLKINLTDYINICAAGPDLALFTVWMSLMGTQSWGDGNEPDRKTLQAKVPCRQVSSAKSCVIWWLITHECTFLVDEFIIWTLYFSCLKSDYHSDKNPEL